MNYTSDNDLYISYNNLYTIEVANRLFIDREHILAKLASVLKEHGNNKFGVCLVHRHCVLAKGEIMVGEGNISQPQRDAGKVYAERWLANGNAYEFTREETTSPSSELFEGFRGIVGDSKILGLFYISGGDMHSVALERTEGRRNITDFIPYLTPRNSIATGWRLEAIENGKYSSVTLHECHACSVENNSHIENVNKMEGLQTRTDLGLEIGWLNFDGSGKVHAV